MRRGYTLIEIIITIAITGILSIGMFKAFEAIAARSEKVKILTALSIDSQSALDQLSLMLYNRAPAKVFGYNLGDPSRTLLADATDKHILEWYSLASESYLSGDYSAFVDMNRSSRPNLYSPGTSMTSVIATEKQKWNDAAFSASDLLLIFAGSFDSGNGNEANLSSVQGTADTIILNDAVPNVIPDTIYEKYYLVDTAYAVARGADVDQTAACITDLNLTASVLDNALLLFSDYRPWRGESFCADNVHQHGKVSILSMNVTAFKAYQQNGTLRLSIDLNRTVRGSNPVRVSKHKVVF